MWMFCWECDGNGWDGYSSTEGAIDVVLSLPRFIFNISMRALL